MADGDPIRMGQATFGSGKTQVIGAAPFFTQNQGGTGDNAAGMIGDAAMGPGVVGTTEGAVPDPNVKQAGVYGFGKTAPGVVGQTGPGFGVVGTGGTGVSGGGPDPGFGVFGLAGIGVLGRTTEADPTQGHTGVWGIAKSAPGVVGDSQSSIGVLGRSTSSDGVVGSSTSGIGVSARSTNAPAVLAHSDNGYGVQVTTGGASGTPALYAQGMTAAQLVGDASVSGSLLVGGPGFFGSNVLMSHDLTVTGQVIGGDSRFASLGVDGQVLVGYGSANPGWQFSVAGAVYMGNFLYVNENHRVAGWLRVDGDLVVYGAKGAAVPYRDGSRRLLYSMESPEPWFEDFGRARLIRGKATVKLDPMFAAVVRTNGYYVFLSPEGHSKGLYVSRITRTGFEVREQDGGRSPVRFSYRVVARRKDIRGRRFEKAEALPMPPKAKAKPLPRAAMKRITPPGVTKLPKLPALPSLPQLTTLRVPEFPIPIPTGRSAGARRGGGTGGSRRRGAGR